MYQEYEWGCVFETEDKIEIYYDNAYYYFKAIKESWG